jgi:hypothetical protein
MKKGNGEKNEEEYFPQATQLVTRIIFYNDKLQFNTLKQDGIE